MMDKMNRRNLFSANSIVWVRRSTLEIQMTKKNYFRLKRKDFESKLKKIKPGEGEITFIAKKAKISPILVLKHYLRLLKFRDNEIKEFFQIGLRGCFKQLEKEFLIALGEDSTFSHWGQNVLRKIGKLKEEEVHKILKKKKIPFLTEEEMKKKYPKTPDFLLKEKINVKGREINWIEVKGFHAREIEKRENFKQVSAYNNLFGPGVILYFYGFQGPYSMGKGMDVNTCEWLEMID